MAEEKSEDKLFLDFDGTKYSMEDLSKEQQYLLSQIQDLDIQLNQLSSKQHQVSIAKDGFIQLLRKALEPEDSTED
jgi:prefoldin subunit 5